MKMPVREFLDTSDELYVEYGDQIEIMKKHGYYCLYIDNPSSFKGSLSSLTDDFGKKNFWWDSEFKNLWFTYEEDMVLCIVKYL